MYFLDKMKVGSPSSIFLENWGYGFAFYPHLFLTFWNFWIKDYYHEARCFFPETAFVWVFHSLIALGTPKMDKLTHFRWTPEKKNDHIFKINAQLVLFWWIRSLSLTDFFRIDHWRPLWSIFLLFLSLFGLLSLQKNRTPLKMGSS